MCLFVSACLLVIALLMLSGAAQRRAPKRTPGPLGVLLVGGASRVLNGAAGIGGPPAIVFCFATTGMAVSRATLIAFPMPATRRVSSGVTSLAKSASGRPCWSIRVLWRFQPGACPVA